MPIMAIMMYGNYDVQLANNLLLNTEFTHSITSTRENGDDELLKGYQFSTELNHSPGNFDNYIYYQKVSRDIFLDAGYLYYKDRQTYGISMDWESNPGNGFIKKKQHFLSLDISDWFMGRSTYKDYSVYGNMRIEFKPEINVSFSSNVGTVHDDLWNNHKFYQLRSSISRSKEDWARLILAVSYGDELVYALNDTYNMLGLEAYISGNIAQKYSYSLAWQLDNYNYPKDSMVDYGDGLMDVKLDDRYAIFNFSLGYVPNQKLSCTGGISCSTYELNGVYADLKFYGNLQYEFKRDQFLYAGVQSSQSQIHRSTYSAPLGHYVKNSATAYVKLAISL